MTKKIIVRTGDVAGFFDRAKNAAQRADQGGEFNGTVTLSFEDPEDLARHIPVQTTRKGDQDE